MRRAIQLDRLHAGIRLFRAGLGAVQSASIASLIQAAAAKYGVDPSLALSVAQQESGLNPNAVSSAGAQGVMQLMPATAAQLGVSNPFDPTQNVNAGVQYLAQLIAQFGGNTTAAVAAYNWGPGSVQSAMSQYGGNWLSAAPNETQNYVQSILGITPESNAPTPTIASPLTIDASTGLPIDDTTDTSLLDSADGDGSSLPDPIVYGAAALIGVVIFGFLFNRD